MKYGFIFLYPYILYKINKKKVIFLYKINNNTLISSNKTPHKKPNNERTVNKMLFEKEIKEAQEKLHKKSYYVSNMSELYNDCYEVFDGNNNIMIDYLSVAQLIQLSNMI